VFFQQSIVRDSIDPLQPVQKEVQRSSRGRTILIVEDDSEVRSATEMLIENWGHYGLLASNAAEAKWIVAEGKQNVDLAIVDYQLPGGVDGISLAKDLEEMSAGQMRIILVSGETSKEFVTRVSQSGLMFLTKPVDGKNLREVVEKLLGDQED